MGTDLLEADQPGSDGRRVRRRRNRDGVVDALLGLIRAGDLDPSVEAIAARAGLSPRSLFRYFDDLDDLRRAAIERQHDTVRPLLERRLDASAPLADRVAALVAQRRALFDEMAMVGRVMRLRAPFHTVVADELARTRARLRHQVEELFAPELAGMDRRRAATVVAGIDVVCSFESDDLLTVTHGFGPRRRSHALVDLVTMLLSLEEP